jgi:hypothetical protein
MRRPDPADFALYSYTLAFASSGIVTLAIILSMLKSPLVQILWLALLTSAVGTFLGSAARSDFKQRSASEEAKHQANVGFRVNLGVLIVMLIMALIAVAGTLNLIPGFGF